MRTPEEKKGDQERSVRTPEERQGVRRGRCAFLKRGGGSGDVGAHSRGTTSVQPWYLVLGFKDVLTCKWPVGLMDKASASGAGDSRFESWAGHLIHDKMHKRSM